MAVVKLVIQLYGCSIPVLRPGTVLCVVRTVPITHLVQSVRGLAAVSTRFDPVPRPHAATLGSAHAAYVMYPITSDFRYFYHKLHHA